MSKVRGKSQTRTAPKRDTEKAHDPALCGADNFHQARPYPIRPLPTTSHQFTLSTDYLACIDLGRLESMTFNDVQKMGLWVPIRDCPGRFTLREASPTFSIVDLLGADEAIQRAHSSKARDPVCIASLEDGGVISYSRSDGSWLHTLNTEEGFERKLRQLEIEIQEHTA